MENVSNASSEEELLQLRDEGKISGAEYNDLLAAMRKPPPESNEDAAPGIDKAKSKRKLGRIAFVLMLAGVVLPMVCNLLLEEWLGFTNPAGYCFALCLVFEIAAFVFGVISWPDVFGKATVAVVAVMAVLALKFFS